MKVLFVASECAPFVKTGGLADVIGAVPKALAPLGVSVRIMIPAYPAVADLVAKGKVLQKISDLYGGEARLVEVQAEGLNLMLLDAPHLFDRPGNIYLGPDGNDWHDNHLRYGALSLVASRVAIDGVGGWKPDLVHAHDWQAGLIPVYLHQTKKKTPPCILTIHNVAFQGLFDANVGAVLGLSEALFTPEGTEYHGKIGFLKSGIAFSDMITTVSPTYARELLLPEYGMGLQGLLQARQANLTGILNGIDLEVWDPSSDAALVKTYTASTLTKKAANRAEIEKRFALSENPDAPLFCVISRLTTQKGLDLLIEALPGLVGRGARLAVLGTGEKWIEAAFVGAAHQHKGSVGTIIGYDEKLSHLLQGGSDAILVPSRFEPCGLTQLYGLRYGTIPVVARTGGLADTVIDANAAALEAECATGVQFAPVTAAALDSAIDRTCDLFKQPKVWNKIVQRAMSHPVGWDRSASAYLDLYKNVESMPEK
jgi:starch synthase